MPLDRALIVALIIVFWVSQYVPVPILSAYTVHLGAGLDMVGIVVGSYGFTQMLLRIPIGWFSDRLGRRKPFVIFALVIGAVSFVAMALADSPWSLTVGRSLSGVSAAMWVLLLVMLAATFPTEQAFVATGLGSFASNAGQIIGTMSGGVIAQRWGWSTPFFVSSGVAVVGLLVLLPVREQPASGKGMTREALVAVLTNRWVLLMSGLGVLNHYTMYATLFGFTPIFAQSLGATKADLGWLTTATILPAAFTALAADRLARRSGTRAVLTAGFSLTTVTIALTPFLHSLPALYISQMIGGAGRGLILPILMGLVLQAVPATSRAVAMGLFQSAYAIGMMIGPVVSGAVGQRLGVVGLFESTAAAGLLALAFLPLLGRRGWGGA